MKNGDDREKILRLQALLMVQAADLSSLLDLVKATHHASLSQPPVPLDLDALFVSGRKQMLHLMLERLEKTNPALAARIQESVDGSSTNVPWDYDED